MRNKEEEAFQPNIDALKKIIEQGDAEELNRYAKELGKRFKDKLTVRDEKGKQHTEKELSTSQIRSFLDKVQRMRDFDKNELHLLRPKIAYAAGRHGGRVKELQEVVEEAILLTKNETHFKNFRNFLEAIVAYHQYEGGKE